MITGFDAADEVSRRHWRRFGRGFQGAEAFRRAVRSELRSRTGLEPVRATYDHAGNCAVCGEAGRCPGWHTEEEVRGRSAGNPRSGHTSGAERVAEIILNDKRTIMTSYGKKTAEGIADLIDRESIGPLLEALHNILEIAENAQGEWLSVQLPHCPEWVGTYRDIADLADDAIAKTEKRGKP